MESNSPLPSDRRFGFLFSIVFAIAAAYLYRHRQAGAIYFVGLSALTLLVSLARPNLLHGANRAWMAFGLLLSRVISPVVLGVLFLAIFTPVGFIMRLFGRDSLHLRFKPDAHSYWILRDPPGPAPDSLREQG